MLNMTHFNINIVSDTVCPWCFVGKRKLERGIALYKQAHPNSADTFTTTWQPYYLNPAASKTGIDKKEYFDTKFGPERAAMMQERIGLVGEEVGIAFNYGGKTGHTRDSHRLIQLAKLRGDDKQDKVVEGLFTGYFEHEGDITSHDMLQRVGEKAGLDPLEVKTWLQSDKGGTQVDREVVEAKMRGVTGVPNFVLQGKYEIGGAQEAEAFVKVFERVKELEG